VHIMLAAALIGTVLLQRSEGGALGIGGGGGGGFLTGRGTANLLTRATAALAAGFSLTSITPTLPPPRRGPPTPGPARGPAPSSTSAPAPDAGTPAAAPGATPAAPAAPGETPAAPAPRGGILDKLR